MTHKKAYILLFIIAVVGGTAVYFTANKKQEVVYTTAIIERGRITRTVSETGTVKAADGIDLSFLNTGKINKINFKIGDSVRKNSLLAELDYSSLIISREEAGANLEMARGNLNKLLAGATQEEITVAKAGVQQAKAAYDAAKNEMAMAMEAAAENITQAEKTLNDLRFQTDNDITTYEQAVVSAAENLYSTKATYQRLIDNYKSSGMVAAENKLAVSDVALDAINTAINDEDGKDLIGVQEPSYSALTNSTRDEASGLLTTANNMLSTAKLSNSDDDAVSAIENVLAVLNKTFVSLGYCFNALENSITSADFTQAELDGLKTNISAQQTLIAAAMTAVQTAEHNLNDAILDYNTYVTASENTLNETKAAYDNAVITAQNALASAKIAGEQAITTAQSKVNTTMEAWRVVQTKLSQVTAAANKHDVILARAKIKQAQAALNAVNNQIDNSIIKAPLNGTITKINFEAGERVAAGNTVISISGQSSFEIEVLISEADIAKVNKNDATEITLDAFGDDVKFTGKVFFIEPAETVVQDVIYYKVAVNFNPGSRMVKSGMTANVMITTAEKANVLLAPGRAIVEKNGQGKMVRLLVGGQIREKEAIIGLRGDGGMVEVLSGAREGDEVVTHVKNEK